MTFPNGHVWAEHVLQLAVKAVREWGAQQKPRELAAFATLLQDHGVRTLLEIGTHAGGTARFFAELGMAVTTIDMHGEYLTVEHPDVTYYTGDGARLPAEGWDAVFIDGDHTAEGVRADWERFRSVPIVAFHDIVEHPGCWVAPLWRTISAGFDTQEFVAREGSRWGGIGVVFTGSAGGVLAP